MTQLRFVTPGVEPASRYEQLPVPDAHFQSRAWRDGIEFDAWALDWLETIGVRVLQGRHDVDAYPVDAEVVSPNGRRFLVAAHGQLDHDGQKPGLQRTDTLAKLAWRAISLKRIGAPSLIAVTSHMPKARSRCAKQLADLHGHCGSWLADVVAVVGDLAGYQRLRWFLTTDPAPDKPQPAPWWHRGSVNGNQLDLFSGH